jgi:hypothetical protein
MTEVTWQEALAAAERIANYDQERCDCLPPCRVHDDLCACIRRAKLALGTDVNVTAGFDAFMDDVERSRSSLEQPRTRSTRPRQAH